MLQELLDLEKNCQVNDMVIVWCNFTMELFYYLEASEINFTKNFREIDFTKKNSDWRFFFVFDSAHCVIDFVIPMDEIF